jgi:hypothetical protein
MKGPLSPVHRHKLGRVSCNIDALVADGAEECFSMEAVEAEDLSTKELAVEDDESPMESPVKLRREALSEREKVSSGGRTRWTLECWLIEGRGGR